MVYHNDMPRNGHGRGNEGDVDNNSTRTSSKYSVPSLQVDPVHPGEHWHVLGATQEPWLESQPWEQIAKKIWKESLIEKILMCHYHELVCRSIRQIWKICDLMYLSCILLSLNDFSSIHCSNKLFWHWHFWSFGHCTLFLVWKIIIYPVNFKNYPDKSEIGWIILFEW